MISSEKNKEANKLLFSPRIYSCSKKSCLVPVPNSLKRKFLGKTGPNTGINGTRTKLKLGRLQDTVTPLVFMVPVPYV